MDASSGGEHQSSTHESRDSRIKRSHKPSRYKPSRQPGDSMSSKMASSKTAQSRMGKGGHAKQPPLQEQQAAAAVVIRDEFGNDVTPRSLIADAKAAAAKTLEVSDSVSESQSSAFDSKPGAPGLSSMGSDGDTVGGMKTPELDEASASENEGGVDIKPAAAKAEVAAPEPAAVVEALTEAQLDELVTLELSETETIWLLDIPSTCVAMDSPAAANVQTANAAYDELLEKRKTMADMYVERAAQTFNNDLKPKEVQTISVRTNEMSTQATVWDIADANEGVSPSSPSKSRAAAAAAAAAVGTGGEGYSAGGGGAGASAFLGTGASGEGSSSLLNSGANVSSSFLEGSSGMGVPGVDALDVSVAASAVGAKPGDVSLRQFHNLPAVMRVVERMVAQNAYHAKHLQYRHIAQRGTASVPPPNPDDESSSLELLWPFISEVCKGVNVSCLEWNPENRDLLAAGYGEFDFARQEASGLILFWSLKNPEAPDKEIRTPCGVTAVSFSSAHPNLLAAGLYDGTVCIYDVRKNDNSPILESAHTTGKHTDPVWQLCWVDQGTERGETLVSISTDGRVTSWNMKKGLENSDLMKLKRVSANSKPGNAEAKGSMPGGATASAEGIISRRASGLCIAFQLGNPNIYIAGTEDGHIHKCSCSYNEQHLESFFGHSGPVYKLRWSPFCPNTFLSCSADWTIKLWHQERSTAIFTFSSSTDYVADIAWSPNNSTVFASVTGDGRIDVWDVSVNTLDPLTSITTGRRLSTVAFSNASPVLVVGHEGGGVDVYSLQGNLALPLGRTSAEQIGALDKITSTVSDHGTS